MPISTASGRRPAGKIHPAASGRAGVECLRAAIPIDEPVRGVLAYLEHPGLLKLSGLEQTQLFQRGALPPGPLWYLTGIRLTESSVGTATWQLPITPWLRSPAGVVPGGVLAFAADGALGSAVHTALPARRLVTTADLTLHFVRSPDDTAKAITARARLIHVGRHQGLSEATVSDTTGHLLAHATSRCMLIEVAGDLPDPPATPVAPPEHPGPHPFQRPAVGRLLPEHVLNTTTGTDLLHGWQSGVLPRSPLSNLLDIRIKEVADGDVQFEVAASPWFVNLGGTVYGGLQALLADCAIHAAIRSTVPPTTSWATLDLKMRYLRPVMPDARPLRAHARVVHRGRRVAVSHAELTTADGKTAALVDEAVMLLENRPWSDPVTTSDERLGNDDPSL